MVIVADLLNDSAIEHEIPRHWGVLADHYHRAPDYSVHRSRGSGDFLLTYTISGQGGFLTGNSLVTCNPGDLVCISPGTEQHYGTVGESWEFLWVHFLPKIEWMPWIQDFEATKGIVKRSIIERSDKSRIQDIFRRMIHSCQGFSRYDHAFAMNAVEELLIVLAQMAGDSRGQLDPRIQNTLQFLSQNFRETISIEILAHRVGISPSRLSHLFREEIGDSIINTLNRLRLRHAARLLERTHEPVSEIAFALGYQSIYYFSRQFRKHYGISPTEYRKTMMEKSRT